MTGIKKNGVKLIFTTLILLAHGETAVESDCNDLRRNQQLDLFFLLDSSTSIHQGNFTKMLDFVERLVQKLDIGENSTRVGVLQYNGDYSLQFSMNQYYKKDQLIKAIKDITYETGVTHTGKAIKYVTDSEFVKEKGARDSVQNVAVVITDGFSQDDVVTASNAARSKGVNLIAVGISRSVNQRQLLEIAGGSSSRVFLLDDFESFNDILNSLINQIYQTADSACLSKASKSSSGYLSTPSYLHYSTSGFEEKGSTGYGGGTAVSARGYAGGSENGSQGQRGSDGSSSGNAYGSGRTGGGNSGGPQKPVGTGNGNSISGSEYGAAGSFGSNVGGQDKESGPGYPSGSGSSSGNSSGYSNGEHSTSRNGYGNGGSSTSVSGYGSHGSSTSTNVYSSGAHESGFGYGIGSSGTTPGFTGITPGSTNEGGPGQGTGYGYIRDVDVRCDDGRMQIMVRAVTPFKGWIFVKGHFEDSACRWNFYNNTDDEMFILVKYDQCGVQRSRSSNPRGMYISTVITFMKHAQFLTQGDRAFRLQCFYMESDKRVTANLEVGMLSTQTITKTVDMPACQYSLRADFLNGQVIKATTVGRKVFHRWDCEAAQDTINVYGMKVHSCFASNSRGSRKVLVIDEVGCAVDRFILGNLNYSNNLMNAYVEGEVFKFADSENVLFDCQISLCLKESNGCDGISPPKCRDPSRGKRDSILKNFTEDSIKKDSFDITSESIIVLDLLNDIQKSSLKNSDSFESNYFIKSKPASNAICLSNTVGIAVSVSLSCIIFWLVSFTSLLICRFKMCHKFNVLLNVN